MTNTKWCRQEVLGEYGWCIAQATVIEDSYPQTILFEFISQACSVRVGMAVQKAGAADAADLIEKCANERIGMLNVAIDAFDDFSMLRLSITPRDADVLISFIGEYGITGVVPCPYENVATVVSMLREGSAQLPDEKAVSA